MESSRTAQSMNCQRRETLDSGFRVQGSGFRVQGSGFRVQGSGFIELRVKDLGLSADHDLSGGKHGVKGLGLRVKGLEFRV